MKQNRSCRSDLDATARPASGHRRDAGLARREGERSSPRLSNQKRQTISALSAGRLAVVASVLTIIMGAAVTAQVARDVQEVGSFITAMAADEGVPQNLVTAMAADEGVPQNLVTAMTADEGVPHNLVATLPADDGSPLKQRLAMHADEGVPHDLVNA